MVGDVCSLIEPAHPIAVRERQSLHRDQAPQSGQGDVCLQCLCRPGGGLEGDDAGTLRGSANGVEADVGAYVDEDVTGPDEPVQERRLLRLVGSGSDDHPADL